MRLFTEMVQYRITHLLRFPTVCPMNCQTGNPDRSVLPVEVIMNILFQTSHVWSRFFMVLWTLTKPPHAKQEA